MWVCMNERANAWMDGVDNSGALIVPTLPDTLADLLADRQVFALGIDKPRSTMPI